MATYAVRKWDEATGTLERKVTRHTRPAAFSAMRKLVYGVLEAFGKLDTPAAHVAMARVEQLDDVLSVGAQVSLRVSNTGKRVTVVRVS